MANALDQRLAAFVAFAEDISRDLDRLSVEQRRLLGSAIAKIDAAKIAEERRALSESS